LKIYTRTGDTGETGLIDGSRVPKDNMRVATYGDVDELNALLGVVRAEAEDPGLDSLLVTIQRALFAIGAQLADPSSAVAERKRKAAVTPDDVLLLERGIDDREAELPPLRAFILPGGSRVGALLHLARTVCRRSERSIVALGRAEPVAEIIITYVNRLSDLLFVMARHQNQRLGREEGTW
jgi:cob(I)alamin adenosyltransferase